MQPIKLNSQKEIFKAYQYSLSQHDNHGLLSETFFHNILLNKHILFNAHTLCKLYNEITHYDMALRQSFMLHSDPDEFAVVFPSIYSFPTPSTASTFESKTKNASNSPPNTSKSLTNA
jgi:hypothetical protein